MASAISPERTGDGGAVDVGARLRTLRERGGRSLRSVAVEAGLSASFVSQIERGLAQPSVSTLFRMADVLGISVAEIFHSTSVTSNLIRREDRRHISFKGLEQELVTPASAAMLQVAVVTLAPGGDSGPEPVSDRSGEECVLILEGEAEVAVGAERYVLRAGDSVTFACATPHRIRNVASAPTRLVISHAPPIF